MKRITEHYIEFLRWIDETLSDPQRTGTAHPLEVMAKTELKKRRETSKIYEFEAKFSTRFLKKDGNARHPRTGKYQKVISIWKFDFPHEYEEGEFIPDNYISEQLESIQEGVNGQKYLDLTSKINGNTLKIFYDPNDK